MKRIRTWAGLFLSAFLVLATAGNVTAASFSFDELPYLAGPAAIETYMEGIYDSDITVVNAIVGNGVGQGPLGPDHYLQSNLSLGVDWFEIHFNAVPITAASFDWGATLNRFIAEADGTEIFDSGNVGYASDFFSAVFDDAVTVLRFHDSCLGEVEIDNLIVQPIPIPGAVWLLGSCLIGFVGLRRRFKTH